MASTSPSSKYLMADQMAGGRLAERLTSLRDEGKSYAAIAAQLREDHGILVSAPTVGVWLEVARIPAGSSS